MNRDALVNMLYRRTQTVKFAHNSTKFLNDMNKPVGFSSGQATEVDGDALAILKAVSA